MKYAFLFCIAIAALRFVLASAGGGDTQWIIGNIWIAAAFVILAIMDK